MSMKRFLLAASASLAGLMVLVCTWSSASAAPGQVVFLCNIHGAIAAHSSTVLTCASKHTSCLHKRFQHGLR